MLHERSHRFVPLLLALLVVPSVWSQQPPPVQEHQGTTFVSGGFGQRERDQLQAMAGQFNLKLVFALDAGNYLAGITVRILDQQGAMLVEATSDGPILMAKLPAGTYTVTARNQADEKERSVKVGNQGMTEVTFTWQVE